MRLFLALEIPDRIKNFLSKLIEKKYTIDGISFVQRENFHITLKFLGEVDENLIPAISEKLSLVSKEFYPFSLKISNPGVFPDKSKPRVIWIGTENKDNVKRLVFNIEDSLEKLGFKKEQREFKAHITLARIKNTKNGAYIFEKIQKNFRELLSASYQEAIDLYFDVNDFVLMKSILTPKGSIYEVLQRFSLLR